MRKDSGSAMWFGIMFAIMLVVGVVISLMSWDLGLRTGAKIGIALESPTGYRAEEVRGSCEDLFRTEECESCHTF